MSYKHSVGVLYHSPEGNIANTTEDFLGDENEGIDTTVPPTTVDQVEELSIDVSTIVCCCLYSAVALTVKTYAAGVLKQTINLRAGKQIVWDENSPFANPFTDDFDHMKLSNADLTKATNFKARFLLN